MKHYTKIKREYTNEFKHHIVQLYLNGEPAKEFTRDYDLTESAFHKWI